jgi:hypothetical protein
MTKRQRERKERLLPDGKPRKIRIYDNGGETSDRYTAVFTGNYKGRKGCDYVGFNGHPTSPNMGVYLHGNHDQVIDYPSYRHLGKKIKFEDLPEICQKLILRDYNDIWELNEPEENG